MHWLPILMSVLTWHSNPFAALISLQSLTDLLNNYGYIAVALVVMIESSGIPLPGETMLLLAAFTAGAVPGHLSIPLVIACAAFGAIIGDNIGYYVGRTGGRAFVLRFGKYVFVKPEHIDRAEKFFARHGNKTVFFGRFIAVLRAWAAFLAGVHHMGWRNFLIYNAAGGILWATIFGTLGYFAGRFLHDNFTQVEKIAGRVSLVGAIAIIATVVALIVLVRLRRARHWKSESSPQTSDEKVTISTELKVTISTEVMATSASDPKTPSLNDEQLQTVKNGKTEPTPDAKVALPDDEMMQPINNGKVEPPNDAKVAPVTDEKSA